ncbi:acetyltransferase [Bacillus sp. CGMCC 1.16541]|uniref:acetyltransferase n=1 Tax=Bacillus sp. CGMCC 1.16541 TaxID=2185143 RepID=UPI000D73F519|nr:acetyltransferase [Bacillus sp. CGMCC 1.16541]
MKWGVIGTGGHSKVVVETIQTNTLGASFVFFSSSRPTHPFFSSYLTLHDTIEVMKQYESGIDLWHVAIGHIDVREAKLIELQDDEKVTPPIIHQQAIVSPTATIGEGSFIHVGVIINACATIGQGTIINTAATIDHDCIIGNYVNIGPGSHLAGGVSVGEKTELGTGVNVRPNVHIGRRCIIGAGSVVVSDIPDDSVVYGVPARVIRKRV